MSHTINRREFLTTSSLLLLSAAAGHSGSPAEKPEPVIDIHQHTNYSGRSNEQMIAHQRAMGVTKTFLLPAGALYGLAANAGGNQTVYELAKQYPDDFAFFANEVADLPGSIQEMEKYLKLGAIGIGEQKFRVDCDSPHIERVAELAQEHRVPVLMHFQHETYNLHFERFHRILRKYPKVNFIGHAQTWWGNIDARHEQKVLYPTGPVTPGGLTDRYLADYQNMYADLSAGSGLNALIRDEDFTVGFLGRHQDKLLYGSDCNDILGRGPGCQGARTLETVRRLAPSKKVERKVLCENARRLFRL